MVEKGVTEGMNRFYFLLKASMLFWGLSLMGGLIFGIAPALLALMDVIGEVDWDYKELSFAKMKPLFRENFKRGNQLMYSSLSILIFLFLSLYTASQMTGMLFLMIDFLLVVLLIMVSVASLMGFVVSSRYEISLNNLIKLSLILLFKEIKASLAIVVLLVVLIVMTIKLPAITFFVGSGIMAYFLNNLGEKIEKSLVLE
ncbi:MAG: DUF624 domain-containing protein [Vagococcus sp.]|uniref:YesL family protein n=1 Tax=Vagococcus TaxID=2737 RepID=UPI002FC7B311